MREQQVTRFSDPAERRQTWAHVTKILTRKPEAFVACSADISSPDENSEPALHPEWRFCVAEPVEGESVEYRVTGAVKLSGGRLVWDNDRRELLRAAEITENGAALDEPVDGVLLGVLHPDIETVRRRLGESAPVYLDEIQIHRSTSGHDGILAWDAIGQQIGDPYMCEDERACITEPIAEGFAGLETLVEGVDQGSIIASWRTIAQQ
ncbi:MAG TPA: hypothetical protein VHT70_00465 [Candidatus Saccharimonadales bacterium]|jgi:hypothetical protein|nr:hypothetical protein [Candidatus Saccharimonadales bacterium]